VIIFDEYYHAVFKHKLTINAGGAVQGIYGLREVGQRRLMLGGLCGNQFKDEILPKLVKKPIFIDQFPSVFSILGQSIDGGIKVTTLPSMVQLKNACMEHIAKRAVLRPVVVIGGNHLAAKLRVLLPKDVKVYDVRTAASVASLKLIQESVKVGVILLSEDLSYGTDLRFMIQPECVVLAKDPPCHYDFM
jgi:hypothetical protein